MRFLCSAVSCLLLISVGASAKTVIHGVTNAAGFMRPGLPNSGLAQGGMATLFGTDLGPAQFQSASAFPLSAELAGVSVEVVSGGTAVTAIPVRVSADQTTVIIPSETPPGAAEVTLSYEGETSPPVRVEIVAHGFGIFALNQGGSGPGIFTNASSFAVNTLFSAGAPGEATDIWGVGLGAVPAVSAADERESALPGDLRDRYDIRVLVGGHEAELLYAGRSGCCAGLDQVRFVIPGAAVGCYVPVVVLVDGRPSNTVTMSVAGEGGACTDPAGLSPEMLETAQSNGGLRIGTIDLSRSSLEMPVIGEQTTDVGAAEFELVTEAELIAMQGDPSLFPAGSCLVFQFPMSEDQSVPDPSDLDPVQPRYLDAGASINIQGPMGARSLSRDADGRYTAILGGGLMGGQQPPYLTAGSYTFDNSDGGVDVGAFRDTESLPEPLEWTNREQLTSVPGGQDLVVTWSGGQDGMVTIMGASSNDGAKAGTGFLCQAESSSARFAVPAWVIDSLPPSSTIQGFPAGLLSVASTTAPRNLDTAELDLALILHSAASQKVVGYHTGDPSGGGGIDPPTGFAITSSSFADGGTIAPRHAAASCGGENVSPQISIHNGPEGTVGYVLLVDDMDAVNVAHWAAWNIPADITSISEGNPTNIGVPGKNTFGDVGYTGPCPPPGEMHRYRFRIWALPLMVTMESGTDVMPLIGMLAQLGDFALGSAEYTGTFAQ